MRTLLYVLSFLGAQADMAQGQQPWRVSKGAATFLSEAPLERIEAQSTVVSGLLDLKERTFVVQVGMRGFHGFNNPLQEEHFNESYVESGRFPNTIFQGRIIEATDLAKAGSYRIRAKGQLSLHGIRRDRIVPCNMTVASDEIHVVADYEVLLSEHDIRVPRIVQQKVSGVIKVHVDVTFVRNTGR